MLLLFFIVILVIFVIVQMLIIEGLEKEVESLQDDNDDLRIGYLRLEEKLRLLESKKSK